MKVVASISNRSLPCIGCKYGGRGMVAKDIIQAMNGLPSVETVCLFSDVCCFTRKNV
ncbi:Unknown protein sequence [Pseudomonas syringae pv. maculicola]|nr:Unknown protein sequence [Pseudomonas syringae pv. maculicola]